MIVIDGKVIGAQQIESPFYDARPAQTEIRLLVIHNISLPPGQFGTSGIEQLFTGTLNSAEHPFYADIAGLKVSAHCVIYRDGRVVQFVPFTHRAWHAGVSTYQGQQACNDFSIGIELEGTDSQSYTEVQYKSLAQLTTAIMDAYPSIGSANIVGHCDIAPGRKTDPGVSFHWQKYRADLAKLKRKTTI